jgi:hypothetical protein
VRVAVTLLGTDGTTSVVAGPVDSRRWLVTQGNYQLSDGMAVRQNAPTLQTAPERRRAAALPLPAGS